MFKIEDSQAHSLNAKDRSMEFESQLTVRVSPCTITTVVVEMSLHACSLESSRLYLIALLWMK